MAGVVMGTALGVPGTMGKMGWKRLRARIWDFSSTARTTACSGGSR